MQTILVVFHLFLAVGLVGLILIQHGKGADMGAAFGSGASGTVFGSKGSASFLTRLTAGLATLFFVTSMVMAYFAAQRDEGGLVLDLQQPATEEVEVQPQSDLPPMPGGSDAPPVPGSDLPPVTPPAADSEEPAATESSLPPVPAAEAPQEPQSSAPAVEEAPAAEPPETAPPEASPSKE